MDDGVKQRIVGAFVLLALAVIFVPVFFDRERMAPVDRTTQIPLAPQFSGQEIQELSEINETVSSAVGDLEGGAAVKDAVAPQAYQNDIADSQETETPSDSTDNHPIVKSASVKPANVKPMPDVIPSVKKVLPSMPPNKSVAAEHMFVPNDKTPYSPEPVEPKLDKHGVPESWVIQVASYRIEGHAKKMRDDLVKMGLKAYVREVKAKSGNMTRVYVGPKLDKSRLVDAQKIIDEKYNIKTILTRFKP